MLVFPLGENRTDSTFLGWEISERSVTEKGPERGLSYFLGLMPSSGRGFLFCELYFCFFINMKHVEEEKKAPPVSCILHPWKWPCFHKPGQKYILPTNFYYTNRGFCWDFEGWKSIRMLTTEKDFSNRLSPPKVWNTVD